MKEPLKPLFNELSLVDRFTLKSASMMKAVTGIARDDTKQNPWRYPIYAAFVGFIMAPIPLPGTNLIPILLFVGIARTRLTPWARMADDRLCAAFNSANVMETHKQFIAPDSQNSGYKVKKVELAKDTGFVTLGDLYDATRSGWRALKRAFT